MKTDSFNKGAIPINNLKMNFIPLSFMILFYISVFIFCSQFLRIVVAICTLTKATPGNDESPFSPGRRTRIMHNLSLSKYLWLLLSQNRCGIRDNQHL